MAPKPNNLLLFCLATLPLLWLSACQPKGPVNPADYGLEKLCPGAEGCLNPKGALQAGAASVDISPTKYERARFSYMKEEGFCPTPTPLSQFGIKRCGQLVERAIYGRRDCGHDGICPRDKIKTRITCDANTACPTGLTCDETEKRCILRYDKPDADGSEKDGQIDWFVDCGRDNVCPCLDANDKPSYFGADKKTCLTGHKANPEYKGPDADGSEGNGKFEGVWMAGFDGNHPMQGKNDSIWARALVLRTGEVTIAILSLDLVGYFYDSVERVRKAVQEQLPKGEIDYIMISSTHSHEGPDVIGQWGRQEAGVPAETGVDPVYAKEVVQKATKAIIDAYNNLKDAKLTAAQTKTGREGFLRDSRDPVILDDTLNVLRLTGTDGSSIATLVNWGNHPEVLSDPNNYLTSDFSHYWREALEKGLPKGKDNPAYPGLGGIAIYVQGAVGGLMTPLGIKIPDINGNIQDKSDWDKAKALGDQLAIKTFKALESAEEIKDPTIALWSKTTFLPLDNKAFQAAFNIGIFDRAVHKYDDTLPSGPQNTPHLKTEVGVIRIGDVTLFTMPGELDPQILVGGYDGSRSGGIDIIDPKNPNPPDLSKAPKGPFLKERIPGKYKLFVGLGNDFIGYILPTWNYQLHKTNPYYDEADGDHYEETNSIGPQAAPLLLKVYDDLLPLLATPGIPPKKP